MCVRVRYSSRAVKLSSRAFFGLGLRPWSCSSVGRKFFESCGSAVKLEMVVLQLCFDVSNAETSMVGVPRVLGLDIDVGWVSDKAGGRTAW